MIDLYTWGTPNGRKISIALEEMALPYRVIPINIGKDEQFGPQFLEISPNNKIPAIIDRDTGLSVFESGAILMYLGDKTGKFYPAAPEKRIRIHEWLMWQMSAVGPFLGRAHYFLKYNAGKAPFAEEWFQAEAQPALWRARQAARRSGIHVRRIFDRRHRDLPVDRALRMAADRSQ